MHGRHMHGRHIPCRRPANGISFFRAGCSAHTSQRSLVTWARGARHFRNFCLFRRVALGVSAGRSGVGGGGGGESGQKEDVEDVVAV